MPTSPCLRGLCALQDGGRRQETTGREKDIIIKRYGLFNTKDMTQKEIAKKMNISRSYVSRLEKRAITKILREFIKNKKI